jgi:hypothetical protein
MSIFERDTKGFQNSAPKFDKIGLDHRAMLPAEVKEDDGTVLLRPRRLFLSQIDGGELALLCAFEIEANALAFGQIPQPSAFDRTDMDEYIRRAILGRDEAETRLNVEPFNGTGSHMRLLCCE